MTYSEEIIITDYLMDSKIFTEEKMLRAAITNLFKNIPINDLKKILDIEKIEPREISEEEYEKLPASKKNLVDTLGSYNQNQITISIKIDE